MSAYGTKRTNSIASAMSAFDPKADNLMIDSRVFGKAIEPCRLARNHRKNLCSTAINLERFLVSKSIFSEGQKRSHFVVIPVWANGHLMVVF
jgi:hypothetical protein